MCPLTCLGSRRLRRWSVGALCRGRLAVLAEACAGGRDGFRGWRWRQRCSRWRPCAGRQGDLLLFRHNHPHCDGLTPAANGASHHRHKDRVPKVPRCLGCHRAEGCASSSSRRRLPGSARSSRRAPQPEPSPRHRGRLRPSAERFCVEAGARRRRAAARSSCFSACSRMRSRSRLMRGSLTDRTIGFGFLARLHQIPCAGLPVEPLRKVEVAGVIAIAEALVDLGLGNPCSSSAAARRPRGSPPGFRTAVATPSPHARGSACRSGERHLLRIVAGEAEPIARPERGDRSGQHGAHRRHESRAIGINWT